MSEPENRNEGKGFKGLQGLSSKAPGPAADTHTIPERKALEPVLPPAWSEVDQQPMQPRPSQSQTATHLWLGWLIVLGVLGAIVGLFIWAGNQSSSSNSYSSPTVTDYSSPTVTETGPAAPPAGPTVTMPAVGNGLVLTSDQIRYCVYEDRRIKGAEKVVDSYNQASVYSFNAMVADYNSRCSHFRYRDGALTPIENEANAIQGQLEQEGQTRMTGAQAQALPEFDAFNSSDTSISPSPVASATALKFKDFPSSDIYVGPRARVNLVSEFERSFRTRISEAASRPINFAGEYVISVWGCGTTCLMGVAVDTRTGITAPLPGSVCCWEGDGDSVIYRPDSRLLILGGKINEAGVHGTHFYELKNNAFVHLATIPVLGPREEATVGVDAMAAPEKATADAPVDAATKVAASPTDDATGAAGDSFATTYQTSFDCGKARSIPEFLICHDSELAAEDRALAQIYQQAKAAVGNSAELADRARKQWNYREKNCRDKSCLLAWFGYQKSVMNKVAQTGDVNAR